MLRLKANKTALYKLVADYVDNLPPMRSGTEFIKYPRTPDYALNWIIPDLYGVNWVAYDTPPGEKEDKQT